MKKILLFLAAFTLGSLISNAQSWIEQDINFPVVFNTTNNVSAPAPGVVWATAEDGDTTLINLIDFSRTIDGGLNWVAGTVGTDTNFKVSNLSAINGDTAWACMFNHTIGTGGGIWRTVNGGFNWTQQGVGLMFDANSFPDVVHFWNGNNGVTIGDPNNGYFEIYTTVDGGTVWTRTPSGNIPAPLTNEFGLTDNYDVCGDTIWFNTDMGRLYRSIDKGLNWTVSTVLSIPPASQLMRVKFLDGNNGIASIISSANGLQITNGMRRTIDGGLTWFIQPVTGSFMTGDFGRVPGSGMYISTGAITNPPGHKGSSYSLDSGATWTVIDTIWHFGAYDAYDIDNVWSGSFVKRNASLFLVGGMFKLVPGILGVRNNEDLSADVVTYPNPSSGIVHMNFKTEKSVDVNVSVINLIGMQVYKSVFAGRTEFTHTFDFSFLPKGMYILNLEYGSERSTQKLMID